MLYVKRAKLYDAMNAIRALVMDMKNEEGLRISNRSVGDDAMKDAVLGLLTIITGYPVCPDDTRYMDSMKKAYDHPFSFMPTSAPCGGPDPKIYNSRGTAKLNQDALNTTKKDIDDLDGQ